MKQVLCLDLGTTMGFAFQNSKKEVTSGFVSFDRKQTIRHGVRYKQFREWLLGFLEKNLVEELYYEDVIRHEGTISAHVYGGFQAIMMEICESHQIPYYGVGVKVIKKAITGTGNADKAAVIAALRLRGIFVQDHNEADALALLQLVSSRLYILAKSRTLKPFFYRSFRYSQSS